MTRRGDTQLWPLWGLAVGVAAGAGAAGLAARPGLPALHWLLGLAGAALLLASLASRSPKVAALALAGLALGGARGLADEAHRVALAERLAAVPATALRTEVVLTRGWSEGRWGWRTQVRVRSAHQAGAPVWLPRRCTLEVRGPVQPGALPPPGSTCTVLAAVRSTERRPLLVASSPRLVKVTAPPHGLEAVRAGAAAALLEAAGTRPHRVRAAELAAALTLGRRDLVPTARREQWRRSGLAHALAVSGLHVGLVGGAVWLLALAAGATPTGARLSVLLALPLYALLAGAPPSAMRAALMGVVYLGARLLGRAPLPLAAVLVTVVVLLLAAPGLAADPGFQLTVVVTAALIRWAPPLAARLPLPRRAALVVAVPAVAQLAAAPLVAAHFRALVPGAFLTNTIAPLLLAPLLLAAVTALALAPLWGPLAIPALAVVGAAEHAILAAGALARGLQLTAPHPGSILLATAAAAAALALAPGRPARAGVLAWGAVLAALLLVHPTAPPAGGGVTLLPVSSGAAVLLEGPGGRVLVDGGRYPRQAVELLADLGVHRLDAVLASHTDEDHVGGLAAVLDELPVRRLVIPRWMESAAAAVPLLRSARRRGVAVVGTVRCAAVGLGGGIRLETLWPPAAAPPGDENQRSLVARLAMPAGTVLVTSDIARTTEERLARTTRLRCSVLLLPHHGSRGSGSEALLRAASPELVLVPAGPGNLQHHPHRETLDRLRRAHLRWRDPAHCGWCGASAANGQWRPFP